MEILGENIKRLRQSRGYSLREFAKIVNVSNSFISQVESGKISPSLAKLKDISNALNTTIGSLIGENNNGTKSLIIREKDRKHADHLGIGINIYLLSSQDPNKQMEPLLIKMSKDASAGKKQYQHYGQEFALVLKGKCEITLNNTRYILNKGDSIYFNSSIPHSFRNISKGDTEVIWVETPPTF